MTGTPEQDGSGQWSRDSQQGEVDRPPFQPGAPGTEQYSGAPACNGSAASAGAPTQARGVPAQPQAGTVPPGSSGQPQAGAWQATDPATVPADEPAMRSGRQRVPVAEEQTHVSGRRVVQYFIDALLVSIVPYLVSIPFDVTNSTLLHILGGVVAFVLFLIIGFWYWVIRPKAHNGQTFAMQWFGIRVVSKNGGPASTPQYFIRWIGLIIDGFPWIWPFTGLLGLLVMVVSRYRQRVGDHMARTLVISEGLTSAQAARYGVDSGTGQLNEPAPPVTRERPETGL